MTMSVRLCSFLYVSQENAELNHLSDMVLEDVTEL